MSEKQPETLKIADSLELSIAKHGKQDALTHGSYRAVKELRRLHEVNAELLESLIDTLHFLERHSNRWDGVNGKHPFAVCESAKAAIAKATKGQE